MRIIQKRGMLIVMKEQRYVFNNVKSFELKHIFECGQCFRWNLEQDNSYTGVVGKNVLNVKKEQDNIIIKGVGRDNIKDVCTIYFDLNTNYEEIKERLSQTDDNLKLSITYGSGIRILYQDIWEALISFIISANNNIPRIKGIIERLSEKYGQEIEWKGKKYYTFPTPEELSKASIQELRKLGLGFRDTRVFETTQMIVNKEIDLQSLEKIEDSSRLREELLKFPGVGPKVADCIMLFSMKKYDVFPIDVWVKRVMTELYGDEIKRKSHIPQNSNLNNKQILTFAQNKFGNMAGLAQQYLFYYARNSSRNFIFYSI